MLEITDLDVGGARQPEACGEAVYIFSVNTGRPVVWLAVSRRVASERHLIAKDR